MADTIRIDIEIGATNNTEPELSNLSRNIDRISVSARRSESAIGGLSRRVTQFDRSSEKTQRSLSKWAKEKYQVYLEAKERISPVLSGIGGKLKGFAGRTWGVTMKAVDLVTAPVRGIINLLRNPIFQVGAVLGVTVSLSSTINTYKDFEAAMYQVKAVSGATGTEFDKLTEKAKYMGATTKFTAKEAAEGFNYMAMAGWKTDDMLNGIEGIMNLAAASGEDLGTTSDIVTDALTAFGLKASDSGHFADVLAQASSNANTNVSMLGESFKYVAPVAGAMKYSVEDVSLALGLMANASVKGSMAGTALKTSLARMAAPTDKISGAMSKYGISLTDSKGKMKTLKELMDNVRGSLGGLAEAEQTAAASIIFGKEAMAGMLSIVNASEKDYKNLTKAVNNADGAAQEMAETMLDNLEGSITLLQSAADGVKNEIGERLSPYVRGLAKMLTDAMPDIQHGLENLMDLADRGFMKLQKKYKNMISTDEWKNADIFGKAAIAWNEFIAEPFSDWWDKTGRNMIVSKAGDIGHAIGSGINSGIMALLGIDVVSSEDEGVSIGRSFSKGFAEGLDFDAISGKLAEGFKNMLFSAGKLLPGGENPDLNSFLSAMVLSKMAIPLISIGGSTAQLGRAVFGKGESGVSLAGMAIGSLVGSTGNATMQGTGLLNILANAGYSLTGGSASAGAYFGAGTAMSGTSAALLGGGAIVGSIVGGVSLISGGIDAYNAYKSYENSNKERGNVEAKSAAYKLAGVGTGALVGATIGSVIPVVGTAAGALIGAGIGGIGGWIAGNNEKKNYEKKIQEEEVAAKAAERASAILKTTGLDIDKVTFKSATLNQAMRDTEVSAEEFGAMLQEAVSEERIARFGDISLSLQEIQELSKSIVFGKQTKSLEKFTDASNASANAFETLNSNVKTLDKLNWELSLGKKVKVDDDTIESYKEAVDNYVESAKEYLKNEHYEATLAMKFSFGDDAKNYTKSLDSMYGKMEKEIDRLNNKLSKKVKIALKDGVITLNEREEIESLEQQIQEITNSVSELETEAGVAAQMDMFKFRYGTADLNSTSFSTLIEQAKTDLESMTSTYDDELQATYKNLEAMHRRGEISDKKYNKGKEKAQDNYTTKVKSLTVDVESVFFDNIVEKYGSALKGILPDIEGTISEKLLTAMESAIGSNPNVSSWKDEDIIKWFGLENLDGTMQKDLEDWLKQIATVIPDSVAQSYKSEEATRVFNEILESGDMYSPFENAGKNYADTLTTGISSGISSDASISSIRTSAQTAMNSACANPYSVNARVNIMASYNVVNKPSVPSVVSGVAEQVSEKIATGSSSNNIKKHANGGFVSGRQLSWVGEEGTEVIIPINPKRRKRALSLYEQAGKMLGIGAYANGGIVGGSYISNPTENYLDENFFNETGSNSIFENDNVSEEGSNDNFIYPVGNAEGQTVSTTVQVSVNVTPEFNISGSNGQSEEDIVKVIRRHMKEMADELGGEIAEKLEEVFSNMPLKEA